MASVTRYGMMQTSQESTLSDAFGSCTFASQPRGILEIVNQGSGYKWTVNVSSLVYGGAPINKADDPNQGSQNGVWDITFSGKADQLRVTSSGPVFDGSGRAEILGINGF